MKILRKAFIYMFLLSSGLIVYFLYQANVLEVTTYKIQSSKIPGAFNGYKIVQLTDLHSKQFGKNSKRLIRKIEKVNPDVIVITGDMMNSIKDDGTVFAELASKLVKAYPVYYIDGNHELIAKTMAERGNNTYYTSFIAELENIGVQIINDKKAILEKDEKKIHLRGLNIPLIFYSASDVQVNIDFDKAYMDEKIGEANEEVFEIVLAHYPKYFDAYQEWGSDLVLAGHHHGGMIRLPYLDGIISHEGEFFPEHDAGVFEENNTIMIVGRGLGNYTYNIRVFNRPEIVVTILESEKAD
ncbi:metallophosphoesterase [Virgibacillus sp. W0430]|uniref:metallophosphoesterase n=1 Tax=Virgibacillus sp. W0430 TaxID=3391580 RepID=UPI003F45C45C